MEDKVKKGIEIFIKLFMTIMMVMTVSCGTDSTQYPPPWETEEPEHTTTLRDLESAFQDCAKHIGLDCQAGDFISKNPSNSSRECTQIPVAFHDYYYRYDESAENKRFLDNQINAFQFSFAVNHLLNLKYNPEVESKFQEIVEDKDEMYPIQTKTMVVITKIMTPKDLACNGKYIQFPSYDNESGQTEPFCNPEITREHIKKFGEFCKVYGAENIVKMTR